MNPFFRNTAILLFCAIVMNACAGAPSNEALVKDNSTAAAALPANYRDLIARYVLAHEQRDGISINDAMISKPYDDRGAPLFRQIAPEHTPAVCVSMKSLSLFGEERVYLLFTIRNGQVVPLYTHNSAIIFTEGMCPDYTPFRELTKGRVGKAGVARVPT